MSHGGNGWATARRLVGPGDLRVLGSYKGSRAFTHLAATMHVPLRERGLLQKKTLFDVQGALDLSQDRPACAVREGVKMQEGNGHVRAGMTRRKMGR